jgi:phosphoribosylformylglycinamidine (FGAM) synthase PurS component
VTNVRAGKAFRFDVEAADEDSALEKATAMAERLLSNPVIENATARSAAKD